MPVPRKDHSFAYPFILTVSAFDIFLICFKWFKTVVDMLTNDIGC